MFIFYIINNPKYEQIIFSDDFKELCGFLSSNFEFVEAKLDRTGELDYVPIWAFIKILPILESFPYEQYTIIVNLLKLKWEKLVANDILLLLEMVRRSELLELIIQDRDNLIAYIKDNLWEDIRRTFFWDLSVVLENAKKEWDMEKINKYKNLIDGYSERPDLNNLSNLDLIRILFVLEAMKDEDFIDKLGIVVSDDLKDSPQIEHWWVILFDWDKLILNNIDSSIDIDDFWDERWENNWSYSNFDYVPMHWWLLHFHLHALSIDESRYAWPSGYMWLWWDFPFSRERNTPWIIFTPIGYPKDQDWNDITDKVRVNVDYFFVDERDSVEWKNSHIVVDLWVYVVNLK